MLGVRFARAQLAQHVVEELKAPWDVQGVHLSQRIHQNVPETSCVTADQRDGVETSPTDEIAINGKLFEVVPAYQGRLPANHILAGFLELRICNKK